MFTAVLFVVSKTWRQLRCPSIDDCIETMWCIYTMEYYSALRKDKILPFGTTWMDLEDIMLREVSQTGKVKNHMTLVTCGI